MYNILQSREVAYLASLISLRPLVRIQPLATINQMLFGSKSTMPKGEKIAMSISYYP